MRFLPSRTSKHGPFGFEKHNLVQQVWRFIQLILALAVVGLYGQDLHRANKEGKYSDGKWVYAVVAASLSAVTAVAYMLVSAISTYAAVAMLFPWDFVLFILWVAVFGLFGSLYIKEHAEMDGGVQRMKNAVWVDLTNMILWLISGVYSVIVWWRTPRSETHRMGRRSKFDE